LRANGQFSLKKSGNRPAFSQNSPLPLKEKERELSAKESDEVAGEQKMTRGLGYQRGEVEMPGHDQLWGGFPPERALRLLQNRRMGTPEHGS